MIEKSCFMAKEANKINISVECWLFKCTRKALGIITIGGHRGGCSPEKI